MSLLGFLKGITGFGRTKTDEELCEETEARTAAFRKHLWGGDEPDAAWDAKRDALRNAREEASDACWRLLDRQHKPKGKKTSKR